MKIMQTRLALVASLLCAAWLRSASGAAPAEPSSVAAMVADQSPDSTGTLGIVLQALLALRARGAQSVAVCACWGRGELTRCNQVCIFTGREWSAG